MHFRISNPALDYIFLPKTHFPPKFQIPVFLLTFFLPLWLFSESLIPWPVTEAATKVLCSDPLLWGVRLADSPAEAFCKLPFAPPLLSLCTEQDLFYSSRMLCLGIPHQPSQNSHNRAIVWNYFYPFLLSSVYPPKELSPIHFLQV